MEGIRTEAKAESYEFWFNFESDSAGKGKGFRCFVIGEPGEAATTEAPPTTAEPGVTTSAPSGGETLFICK